MHFELNWEDKIISADTVQVWFKKVAQNGGIYLLDILR